MNLDEEKYNKLLAELEELKVIKIKILTILDVDTWEDAIKRCRTLIYRCSGH